MKKSILLTFLFSLFIISASAQKTKITTSEPDADIFVNGEKVGTGS